MTRTSLGRVFRQGMLTNVLNPKVAMFVALGLRLAIGRRSENIKRSACGR